MKITPLASLTLLALVSSACSDKIEREPIVIHVFRDPAATEIETALLAVGTKQLRSGSGQPVMIATIERKTYSEGLEDLGRQIRPELVIFNSSEDGKKMKVEIPPESVVQVRTKPFYLVIPSWVPGGQRQAAELVLNEVCQELQRAAQLTTGPPH